MPKTKERKQKDIEGLSQKLADSKSAVFTNYYGLKVKDVEVLRKNCRDNDLSCLVAKKTLLKKVLKEKGIEAPELSGEILAIFSNDEVGAAKISAQFAKEHQALKIVSGLLEGKITTREAVIALSKLPSKQELLGKLLGTLNAPISGFTNVLAGNLRGLVCALNAIKTSKS